jgi:hypothetical protein
MPVATHQLGQLVARHIGHQVADRGQADVWTHQAEERDQAVSQFAVASVQGPASLDQLEAILRPAFEPAAQGPDADFEPACDFFDCESAQQTPAQQGDSRAAGFALGDAAVALGVEPPALGARGQAGADADPQPAQMPLLVPGAATPRG